MRPLLPYVIACLLVGLVPAFGTGPAPPDPAEGFPGWPTAYEGQPLTRLPMGEREMRSFDKLPGMVARFTDGERQFVFRWVKDASRFLHRAEDCFRGSGWATSPAPGWIDGEGRHWGRFHAARDGREVIVREILTDDAGGTWADASAWYWAAVLGRTTGPWWSLLVVESARE